MVDPAEQKQHTSHRVIYGVNGSYESSQGLLCLPNKCLQMVVLEVPLPPILRVALCSSVVYMCVHLLLSHYVAHPSSPPPPITRP